jgi:hypothetical protein
VSRRGDLGFYVALTTPAVPVDVTLGVSGAVSGAMAGTPMVGVEGVVPPRLRATLHRRPNIGPTVAEITGAMNRTWQDELNETGSASMVIPNEDPMATTIQPGDVIRFEDQGWACFAWIVKEVEHIAIARGEEHEQVTKFSGPGLLSIMSEALVYPANSLDALPRGPEGMSMQPIEEHRYFSWQSNAYDDTAWLNAKLYAPYYPGDDDSPPGEPANSGMHAGVTAWPLPGCMRVTTNLGDYWLAPGGWCYFRHLLYLGDNDPTRSMTIYGVADDESRWWFDGLYMYDTFEWENNNSDLVSFTVDVAPGFHYLAVAVHNSELGPMWSENFGRWINPFSLMFAGYATDINTGDVYGDPLFQSDATTKVVDYPPGPPGWTPGKVIDRCMIEAVWSRKTIVPVTINFDEHVDSDGTPWPTVTDISTDVSTDYLVFLKELAETYIDFWMEPGAFVLSAWVKGQRGAFKPDVTLHGVTDANDPWSGNLAGLSYKRVD